MLLQTGTDGFDGVIARPRLVRESVLRHARPDALLILLSVVHGAALLIVPSALLIAVGLWWGVNVVAHNFIHLPFFRSRALNRGYSVYLTLVLGIPQSLWRARHLAHHAGRPRIGWRRLDIVCETALVVALWTTLTLISPHAFVTVYLPGWLLGLGLCQLHGHFEHARGTTSHYGRIYNTLFFNDGYHAEHHARPSVHWSYVGGSRRADALESRWPPVLRWLDLVGLNGLERLVLLSGHLQRFVIDAHARAFRTLLREVSGVRTVTIVGGGLFPRTAIVVSRLAPDAVVTIVDADAAHLDIARSMVGDNVALRREVFDPLSARTVDLLVVPLAYVGDRRLVYEAPGARAILVHDWIWCRRGRGVIVSWLLLKRLNLVLRPASRDATPDAR